MVKRMAHITDLHLDEPFPIEFGVKAKENWGIVLNSLSEAHITDVVFTGDIGTNESNKWFFDSFGSNINLRITLGNHDLFTETVKHYNTSLADGQYELYHTHEDEFYKYIYLDSSQARLSESQFSWFQRELLTNKKVVLFIHHPILETGTTPQKEYPLKGSEKIKNELIRFKNDVYIFCGHLHFNDVQKERNVTQWVTPAACYQIKKHSKTTEADNLSFGYRIIQVTKDELTTELIMFQPDKNKTISSKI